MKKKLTAFLLSVTMLVTLLPSLVFAWTNDWEYPTNFTPQSSHPKVMFNETHIETIRNNLTAPENAAAYADFQRLINLSAKSSTISSISGYWDDDYNNMIEALAFDYVINGNTANGNYAIARAKDYLKLVSNKTAPSSNGLAYRYYGGTIFHAAEVLDWCYPLISSSDASTIMGYCNTIINKIELIQKSTSNHINGQGAIAGHGAESTILRDLLAYGIATKNGSDAKFDEQSLYNAVMGRIKAEYVAPRNYLYASGTTHQGSEYGWYRFYWDLYAEVLAERMRKNSGYKLFDTDKMQEVLYGMIYSRRPDGRFFAEGDNGHADYWYYNNFNRQAAKLAGDLFGNKYFKGEYRRMVGSEYTDGDVPVFQSNPNYKNYMSFNAVQWLIMNDPNVDFETDRSALPKSRYFGSPIGKIYAQTAWGYIKSSPGTYGVASAEMKIGEQYSANHDHLDAGTFQLYFRGLMTGDYNAQDDYGSSFDQQYYKRTVAHNAITIFKSGETWNSSSASATSSSLDYGTGTSATANDGGQLAGPATNSFSAWSTNVPYKRATVINHSIADDNSYSYIKGDITKAYNTSKAEKVVRSMAFLPTGQAGAPAIMVVFDYVKADSSSYTQKFLLHTAAEPTVTNNNKVVYDNKNTLTYSGGSVTYDGRLTMNTLLPSSATITKVSGTKTNGTAYNASTIDDVNYKDSKFEPEWGRVEVQPSSATATVRFLNVLTLSDTYRNPADATIIGGNTTQLVGARIKNDGDKATYNMAVLFANTAEASQTVSRSFTIDGDDTDIDIFVFGLGDDSWSVMKDGVWQGTYAVDGEEGALSFKGDAGTYTIKPYEPSDLNTAVVAWYDYRKTDGSTSNGSVSKWEDLGQKNNDLPLNIVANKTFWYTDSSSNFKGLRINGDGTNVTTLPEAVKEAVNSGNFTIEFAITGFKNSSNQPMSIIGNPRDSFSVYKILGANKVYIKTPSTKTFINRPFWQLWSDEFYEGYGVNNNHCIITVNTEANEMKWYLNGSLVASSEYNKKNSASAIDLFSEDGGTVIYQQIKVFDFALTASEAKGEYKAYKNGTF